MNTLKNTELKTDKDFLESTFEELIKASGYMMLCSLVLQRYAEIFGRDEVIDVTKNLSIEITSETLEITNYSYTGDSLWNIIFEKIAVLKGLMWITAIEPFVKRLSRKYEVPMPDVFESALKKTYELSKQNHTLKEMNDQLKREVIEVRERLVRCPITGLYNFEYFRGYLTSKILSADQNLDSTLMVINIDNMSKIRFSYGDSEVEEVLKSTVYLIENVKDDDESILFRLHGATFAWYFPHESRESVMHKAEKVRNLVFSSQGFIENITLSIGVVFFDKLKLRESSEKNPFEDVYELAMQRVKLARLKGQNIVCDNSHSEDISESLGKILIVDTEDANIDVLKVILENLNYEVLTAKDGETALYIAEREIPDAIITEIMIPKLDAFMLRESLLRNSLTKGILFIILSHLKNEDSVKRSLSLRIEHYFKKPFMLSELLGIIKLKIKGGDYH